MFDVLKGEKGGKPSMMRTMTMIVVISVMGVFVVQNIVAMLKGTGFVSMGAQEAMLIAGVLGAKAAQTFGEGKLTKKAETLPADAMPTGMKE